MLVAFISICPFQIGSKRRRAEVVDACYCRWALLNVLITILFTLIDCAKVHESFCNYIMSENVESAGEWALCLR